jgi:hypothetical protein
MSVCFTGVLGLLLCSGASYRSVILIRVPFISGGWDFDYEGWFL